MESTPLEFPDSRMYHIPILSFPLEVSNFSILLQQQTWAKATPCHSCYTNINKYPFLKLEILKKKPSNAFVILLAPKEVLSKSQSTILSPTKMECKNSSFHQNLLGNQKQARSYSRQGQTSSTSPFTTSKGHTRKRNSPQHFTQQC